MSGQSYPLVVIGAGTAGITAVQQALQLGVKRVALIEKEPETGGDCANYACVPTKTLLTAARFLKNARLYMSDYGIDIPPPQFDMAKLARKVTQVIDRGDFEAPGMTLIRGNARFIDDKSIDVNGTVVSGEKLIIATGSEPVVLPIEGLEETGYLTFKQASRLRILPKSMIIVGGGPVGVEFSQAFQWFGCQITLLEHGERLLSREEPEISQALQQVLEEDGVAIHTGCDVEKVEKTGTGKKVTARCDGQPATFEAEEILLCIGMKPDLEALELSKAGVKFDAHGITVNPQLQTSSEHIWAVGDGGTIPIYPCCGLPGRDCRL